MPSARNADAATPVHDTLRALDMSGPFPLTASAIVHAISRTAAGNYALGYMDGHAFRVFYVGRSDSGVGRRLHEWVGAPSRFHRYGPQEKAPWQAHRHATTPPNSNHFGTVGSAECSYTHFAFSHARSAEEAYGKEWCNFDDFGGRHALDNASCPAAPVAPE